jgi:hypothetical protein
VFCSSLALCLAAVETVHSPMRWIQRSSRSITGRSHLSQHHFSVLSFKNSEVRITERWSRPGKRALRWGWLVDSGFPPTQWCVVPMDGYTRACVAVHRASYRHIIHGVMHPTLRAILHAHMLTNPLSKEAASD